MPAPVGINEVDIVDALTLFVQLDTSCRVEPGLYDGANYVISERFGTGQNLYVKSVVLGPVSPVGGVDTVDSMTLTLRDYVTMQGHYILNIMGLHAFDGTELTCTGFSFVDTTTFALPGPPQPTASSVIHTLRKYLYKWIDTSAGSVLGELLYALSATIHKFGGTDPATQGLQAAKDGLTLRSGVGTDLDVIAYNYGLRRPSLQHLTSDASLKSFIQQMAWEPKSVLSRIYGLVEVALGPQTHGGWRIFEPRPRTVVIDMGSTGLPLGNGFSTYVTNGGSIGPITHVGAGSLVVTGVPRRFGAVVNIRKPAILGTRWVHFLKPSDWAPGAPNLFYWVPGGGAGWPGSAMTSEGGGWWKFQLPLAWIGTSLLVNDGNSDKRTADLTCDTNYELWYDGVVASWIPAPAWVLTIDGVVVEAVGTGKVINFAYYDVTLDDLVAEFITVYAPGETYEFTTLGLAQAGLVTSAVTHAGTGGPMVVTGTPARLAVISTVVTDGGGGAKNAPITVDGSVVGTIGNGDMLAGFDLYAYDHTLGHVTLTFSTPVIGDTFSFSLIYGMTVSGTPGRIGAHVEASIDVSVVSASVSIDSVPVGTVPLMPTRLGAAWIHFRAPKGFPNDGPWPANGGIAGALSDPWFFYWNPGGSVWPGVVMVPEGGGWWKTQLPAALWSTYDCVFYGGDNRQTVNQSIVYGGTEEFWFNWDFGMTWTSVRPDTYALVDLGQWDETLRGVVLNFSNPSSLDHFAFDTLAVAFGPPCDGYLVADGSVETPGQTGGTGPLHTGCFISSRGRIKEFDEIMDLAKAAGVTVEVVRKGE